MFHGVATQPLIITYATGSQETSNMIESECTDTLYANTHVTHKYPHILHAPDVLQLHGMYIMKLYFAF